MEKRRPSYDLADIKRTIGTVETLSIKTKALRDAATLGFKVEGIVEVINGIERWMFCKSMTTFADHRVWQDVYYVPAREMTLYVKFQADIATDFSVVPFKEK